MLCLDDEQEASAVLRKVLHIQFFLQLLQVVLQWRWR